MIAPYCAGKREGMKHALAVVALGFLCACASAPDAVSQNNSDAPEIARSMGVSVEEAERRLALQGDIGAFQERASADPHFAGLYIEHEPVFRAVVLFTDDDPAARLRRYTSDPLYVALPARVAYAQLVAAQESLGQAFAREGVYFMGSSVNVQENRVDVDVHDDDDLRRVVAEGRVTLPDFVHVRERGGIVAQAQAAGVVGHFPQARFPAGAEMSALARGRLVVVDGCLRLQGADGGPGNLVVWPSSALLEERDGVIHVRDRVSGGSVAVGETMEVGGGQGDTLDDSFLTAPVPAACGGPYWYAGSTWRAVSGRY